MGAKVQRDSAIFIPGSFQALIDKDLSNLVTADLIADPASSRRLD